MRKYSVGTEVTNKTVSFRLFADKVKSVDVVLKNGSIYPLNKEKIGYFSGEYTQIKEGDLYKYRLNGKELFPDPFSKFQPEGPHGYSQVVSSKYKWKDKHWKGIDLEDVILYEMHVGTFTEEGTWLSAIKKLSHLADLGITVIEMMPVSEFPGAFNWGYDGVNFFAPTHNYGTADDLRKFIDAAHKLGLGVILDLVYNHFGPDGNYLEQFTKSLFLKENNEWGKSLNYSNKELRNFFVSNALYWIEEFHFDGFRFDACHAIADSSKVHIVEEIVTTLKNRSKKTLYFSAENEQQKVKFITEYGLDSIWNEDFHHTSFVRSTGRSEAYFSDYKGSAQEFVSSIKEGFLYQGQWYSWQEQRRGTPSLNLKQSSLVNFIENHDQVANGTPTSQRLHQLTNPALYRALTTLLLLAPQTPLLFQGQELGSQKPFFYFCDHSPPLGKKVFKGRVDFLTQFESFKRNLVPDPGKWKTFLESKLDWNNVNPHFLHLHKDLILFRKQDLNFTKARKIDGAVINDNAFILRFFGEKEERLLLVNFGSDFYWNPSPEPLLAPAQNSVWQFLWSSESAKYGGVGFRDIPKQGNWYITGPMAMILGLAL